MTTEPFSTQSLSPDEVARRTGGSVIYYPPYHLDKRTMTAGYKTLRRTVLWASKETGRPVPKGAQEVLRWLRDTFIEARESTSSSDQTQTSDSSKREET